MLFKGFDVMGSLLFVHQAKPPPTPFHIKFQLILTIIQAISKITGHIALPDLKIGAPILLS